MGNATLRLNKSGLLSNGRIGKFGTLLNRKKAGLSGVNLRE